MQKSKVKTKTRRLLEVLLLVVLLWLFFILAGRALCKIALSQIAELTNTKIKTGSVNFSLNGSVLIKGLVIRPDREAQYDDAILKAETVYARFGIGSLLLLRPRLEKISAKDFVFNAQRDMDTGLWNLAALKIRPLKGASGRIPLVRLKRGTLRYSKVSKGKVKITAAIPLDAKLGPAENQQDGYRFDMTTAETGGFKSKLTGVWKPGMITITGGISSADIPALEDVWMINFSAAELVYEPNNAYSLKLRINDLVSRHTRTGDTFELVRPAFLEKFGPFNALQSFFDQYRPAGQVDIDFEASGSLDRLGVSKLHGTVYCKNTSICNRNFPYAIDSIVGRIDFTEKSVSLNNLRGRHGNVELAFSGFARNFGPNHSRQIQITSSNMALDDDLYNALSAEQKKLWSAFSPGGLAAINYCTSKQPDSDKKNILAVELLAVEAQYQHFPYRLENLTGMLFFDHNSITVVDVASQSGERKITLNGKVTSLNFTQPVYDISIKVNNIPLDSTLAAALPAGQRHFHRQFSLSGLADADIKVFPSKQGTEPTTFIADVDFKKTSLRIGQLPLVVCDISGSAVFTPELIRVKNLKGRYGRGLVSLTGQIRPGEGAEQFHYQLALQAEQVELNDDFFSLLPSSLKKVVSVLKPTGRINYRADLKKSGSAEYPDYSIAVDCLGGSIRLEPFPYPLKDISGSLVITEDSILLEEITAAAADNVQIIPETSTIKINGRIDLTDEAFSTGRFALRANDIFFDERLGSALPEAIQPFYRKLSPTGRFDLDLQNIKFFKADDDERYVDFSGAVRFKDCSFNTSPGITELNGLLKAKALYKTGEWFCDANAVFIADGLRIKGKSLTDLKADVNYNRSLQSWQSKTLVADCYDGGFAGKFELRQQAEAPSEYLLQVGFDSIDLKQFLSDTQGDSKSNSSTSGKMCGSLSVTGLVGDGLSRLGRCRLKITEMQVGRLSALAKLLGVLKLTEPTDFAFERMLVDSYVKGNRVFFEQLDLSGENLAFTGSGSLDMRNQNVDLTLAARGRRLATAEPSVLQSLAEGLGHGIVRMEVTGNLYDPQVTTKTLPVIGDTLQILGTNQTKPN